MCGRKCEDFVTGRWPQSIKIKHEVPPTRQESKVRQHKATPFLKKSGPRGQHRNNKNKQKSKHNVLSSRHKVKFVSHPLPAKNISVTNRQKQVKPESPMHPTPQATTLPAKKESFKARCPLYTAKRKVPKRKAPSKPQKRSKVLKCNAPCTPQIRSSRAQGPLYPAKT